MGITYPLYYKLFRVLREKRKACCSRVAVYQIRESWATLHSCCPVLFISWFCLLFFHWYSVRLKWDKRLMDLGFFLVLRMDLYVFVFMVPRFKVWSGPFQVLYRSVYKGKRSCERGQVLVWASAWALRDQRFIAHFTLYLHACNGNTNSHRSTYKQIDIELFYDWLGNGIFCFLLAHNCSWAAKLLPALGPRERTGPSVALIIPKNVHALGVDHSETRPRHKQLFLDIHARWMISLKLKGDNRLPGNRLTSLDMQHMNRGREPFDVRNLN